MKKSYIKSSTSDQYSKEDILDFIEDAIADGVMDKYELIEAFIDRVGIGATIEILDNLGYNIDFYFDEM